MDQLFASCEQAMSFPANIIHHDTYDHNLKAYVERLNKRQIDLFHADGDAKVDIVDFDAQTSRNLSKSTVSLNDLKTYLGKDAQLANPEVSRRFVFLTAPHSNDRLYISRKLLTYILTYHQVMPSFLDFLFPFGYQEYARDMNFSSFRQESRLEPWYSRLGIPELGRSGRELRMCYNLKSVEPCEHQQHMPWSIRQTAVYHSLDLETGKAFWVIVKGNDLIKERIRYVMQRFRVPKHVEELDDAYDEFSVSLATHMTICDWCDEHWRWYISYLEETMSNKTGLACAVMLDDPQKSSTKISRQATVMSTTSSPISEKRWWSSSTVKTLSNTSEKRQKDSTRNLMGVPLPVDPPGPPPGLNTLSNRQPPAGAPSSTLNPYSFTDLQDVQLTGDRVNEVLLVLDSNINVLTKIQDHYLTISQSDHCSKGLNQINRLQLVKFDKRISCIIDNMHMQRSRALTLVHLIADRKELLSGILGIQNTRASNILALRAQESQDNMWLITKDMHTLARKTKSEAVSMRIITLVTLFFLPGTFLSTIMSTDIVSFKTGEDGQSRKVFQWHALQLFLAIYLPMMFVVFVAWYGVYWWVDQKEAEHQQRLLNESEQV